jgi:hypothetical protein
MKSLSNLIAPGPILLAPKGSEVENFIRFMNSTYHHFAEMEVLVFQSEKDSLHFIEENTRIRPFALIIFYETFKSIDYSIRFVYGEIPSTNSLFDNFYVGFVTAYQEYFLSGFLTLQKSIFFWLSNKFQCTSQYSDVIYTPFPTFPYASNSLLSEIGWISSVLLIFSMLFSYSMLCKSLASERETLLYYLMNLMGLSHLNYCMSWVFFQLFITLWISLTLSILLWSTCLFLSSFSVIFFLLFSFGFSLVGLSFLITSIFRTAHLSSTFFIACAFTFSLPYYLLSFSSENEYTAAKRFVSLLSPSAFSFAASILVDSDLAGYGITYFEINNWRPGFFFYLKMIVLDSVLYFFLAYLISLYPFIESHRIIIPENIRIHPISEEIPEIDVSEEIVKFENVSRYSNGRELLTNISFSLYKNQVFCLLGSNGSGMLLFIHLLSMFNKCNRQKYAHFSSLRTFTYYIRSNQNFKL